MDENIISVGKSANKNAAIKDVVSFPVINFVSLNTRKILIIEKIKGKIMVAVSLLPKIKNAIASSAD